MWYGMYGRDVTRHLSYSEEVGRAANMRSLRIASIFSGVGGGDLGMQQAGHHIVLQCECCPKAQQVLHKAFPGVLFCSDVRTLAVLPKDTDMLMAGFPCVDISKAGLQKGLVEGQSSGLVRHVFRLLKTAIEDRRPVQWVLLENVRNLFSFP